MLRARVIPVLLLNKGGLYKGVKFKKHQYVGDPINTVKLFNDKEVDELVLLDISSTPDGREPDYGLLEDVASEAFMPLAYGGGVTSLDQARKIYSIGYEKIVLGSSAYHSPELVGEMATAFGSQSVVVSVDVKKNFFGQYVLTSFCGRKTHRVDIKEYCRSVQERGAGEVLLNDVSSDGMQLGYDQSLIKKVSKSIQVPLVVCGGAWTLDHLGGALESGADAVAAGSMFVYQGKHKAVLISYPKEQELASLQSNLRGNS